MWVARCITVFIFNLQFIKSRNICLSFVYACDRSVWNRPCGTNHFPPSGWIIVFTCRKTDASSLWDNLEHVKGLLVVWSLMSFHISAQHLSTKHLYHSCVCHPPSPRGIDSVLWENYGVYFTDSPDIFPDSLLLQSSLNLFALQTDS